MLGRANRLRGRGERVERVPSLVMRGELRGGGLLRDARSPACTLHPPCSTGVWGTCNRQYIHAFYTQIRRIRLGGLAAPMFVSQVRGLTRGDGTVRMQCG